MATTNLKGIGKNPGPTTKASDKGGTGPNISDASRKPACCNPISGWIAAADDDKGQPELCVIPKACGGTGFREGC
jgi:hypothetical protein